MVKFKKLIGLLTVATVLAMSVVALMGSAVFAAPNEGGVIVGEGDAPDCVGGSCGGVVVEDFNGEGPNCDGGNCGGSICAGPNCGSCDGGNCGGSISGVSKPEAAMKHAHADASKRELPRTGLTLPTASTLALGLGMILVGAFFTLAGSPSAKLAAGIKGYRPKRRL